METRTFTATLAQLQRLSAALKVHGIDFDPSQPTGEGKADGFDVSWTISPGKVVITMKDHPFMEEGLFWKRLSATLGTPIT
jgi:hypothetical protein